MDRSLVERAQRGDRAAYESLARDAAPRLYRTAYRIVRDADRTNDAVQQILVAVWRELPSLRDPDRFTSWTYRLVVRFCTAEARRAKRTGVRQIPMDEQTAARGDAMADVDLRDALDRATGESAYQPAFAPEGDRILFVLSRPDRAENVMALADLDGSNVRPATPNGYQDAFHPRLRPTP